LISAIAMILIIRLQLWITNYPQLGGGRLHIAHLLWGGLLMLVAIGLLLAVLGRRWRQPAAVIGGAGFGFFIDEVGKFVTSNNDYFFKPSAAIIYITFICLYFVARWVRARRGFSSTEYIANALDVFSDATVRRFTERDKQQILVLISQGHDHPLASPLRELVQSTPTAGSHPPNPLARLISFVRRHYAHICDKHWFRVLVVCVFAAFGALNATLVVLVILGALVQWLLGINLHIELKLTAAPLGEAVSDLAAAVLVWVGVVRLRAHRRFEAYRFFERAVLVELFVGQVFAYIDRSFQATWGFLVCLVLLVSLRFMMRQDLRIAELHISQGNTNAQRRPQAQHSDPSLETSQGAGGRG
jgi:hypothetical protein